LPLFPRRIDVERTNPCAFRCLMCPTGTFSQQHDNGVLDFIRETHARGLLTHVNTNGSKLDDTP